MVTLAKLREDMNTLLQVDKNLHFVEVNADTIDEWNRLVWKTSLALGESEKLSCEVVYPQSRFDELPER